MAQTNRMRTFERRENRPQDRASCGVAQARMSTLANGREVHSVPGISPTEVPPLQFDLTRIPLTIGPNKRRMM